MFENVARQSREDARLRVRKVRQREYVFYCFDRVQLAVACKRPQCELDELLRELKLAVDAKES